MTKLADLQRWVCFFSEKNKMPYKHRASDSGFDIHAHEGFTLGPWEKKTICTNLINFIAYLPWFGHHRIHNNY